MGVTLNLDGAAHEIEISRRRPHCGSVVDGRDYEITSAGEEDDGRPESRSTASRFTSCALTSATVKSSGWTAARSRPNCSTRATPRGAAAATTMSRAPMPCTIVERPQTPGRNVTRGETLVTIESMKLQIALLAPRDGTLAKAPRAAGETFEKDAIVARTRTPLDGA